MTTFIKGDPDAPVPEDGTTVVYDEAKGAYVPGPVPGSGTSGTVIKVGGTAPADGWHLASGGTTPPPTDTTPPTVGTLAASAITSTTFTLTVTGASDAVGLHAAPYAFSTDNGTTWSAWQAGATYNVTGRTASTGYQARHKVRDAAGNEATGTAITVTTGAAGPTTITDDFDRADGTVVGTTTTTGSKVWAVNSGGMAAGSGTTQAFIRGNVLSTAAGVTAGYAVLPLGVNAVRAKVDYSAVGTPGTTASVTLVICAAPAGNNFDGLAIRWNAQDGTYMLRGTGTASAAIIGSVHAASKTVLTGSIEIEYDGTTVRGWNGTTLIHVAAVTNTGTNLAVAITGTDDSNRRTLDNLLVTIL